MPTPEGIAEAAHKAASVAQWGGGGTALFFGLTANEFAALGGLVIGLIGLVVNIAFKFAHYQLAREQHKPDPEE
jgi:hypothetical protein